MSAGSKVRGRALRPLTARQSSELLIFGAEEEEIRALWAFSVSAERGDGELTPPPPVCLSVCLLQRFLKKKNPKNCVSKLQCDETTVPGPRW